MVLVLRYFTHIEFGNFQAKSRLGENPRYENNQDFENTGSVPLLHSASFVIHRGNLFQAKFTFIHPS
jgi:hypothetical protein